MKYFLLLGLLITVASSSSFSQTDTTYLFFNKSRKPCEKDTAFYYAKIYKEGEFWIRKDFWQSQNVLQMEGAYLEKDCKTQQGNFTWYKEGGIKNYTAIYEKGKIISRTFYHENGAKKGFISFTDHIQKGWDENGKELKNYIVEKEAKPTTNWKKYLEGNLNADVAAKADAPAGVYPVKVQFLIDKEGNITNVTPIAIPDKCLPCATEAVKVISNGPKWEPAMQNGVPVIYQAIQYVTFQVAEETKKKRGLF
jgi:antitoxin component YwqK of YwqJK toxin-antitoxin module